MSTVIIKPAARPKVYRLPPAVSHVAKPRQLRRTTASAISLALVVGVGMLAINPLQNMNFSGSIPVAMLPAISIGAQEPMGEDASLIGEAHASVGSATQPTVTATANTSAGIISLHGHSDGIVGQITKIPLNNEQITEVKSDKPVDKPANRELLSIVSKY